MKNICICFFLSILVSCKPHQNKITVKQSLLDSISSVTDTSYSKTYRSTEFSTATYFLKKKDSLLFQIMYNKDKAITQIIGIKKGGKFLEQNFYPNGQLVALLQFDSLGFKTGNAVYFYENGRKQREGKFQGGIPVGEWTEYAPDGRILQVLR